MSPFKPAVDYRHFALQASFTEPVYERLLGTLDGADVQVLGFIRPIPESLRQHLRNIGAQPSSHLVTNGYAETWQLSSEWLKHPPVPLVQLDLSITSQLGVHGGQYPAAAGYWISTDPAEKSFASHFLEARSLRPRTHHSQNPSPGR